MLEEVLKRAWPGKVDVATLFSGAAGRASIAQKVRFAATVGGAQVRGRSRWILFTHTNLLRVQSVVPARCRKPYAVFLHGIEAWGPLTRRDTRLLAGARLRLANSKFTATRVMAAHPDIGPVVACPLALPVKNDGHLAARNGEDRGPLTLPARERVPDAGPSAVLIVGRMLASERYKGHDQLIDAWPQVLQAVPDAQLFVVGQGDDVDRLRARAAQAGVSASVVFTGFVGQQVLDALYDRCRVCAMPSRGEGFGLVYLEAMAHGLPCVGCRDDAAAEVIEEGETGVLVDQADIPALAATLVSLLRDPARCRRMGAAGAARVREVYSFERFAAQVTGCLRSAFQDETEGAGNVGALS
ncbi:MAG: glycosyltransferase family 4 protein [Bacteroidales bacterium]